jgi:DsbC/DsbD-like thiol-disulfide interchange protein
MSFKCRLCFAVATAALVWGSGENSAGAIASPWQRNPQGAVRLVSADRIAARQGELQLGVEFQPAPGWHVYWKNSGDAGFAPSLSLAPLQGLEASVLSWPAPLRFDLPGGLVAFGYENEVLYPLRASLHRDVQDRGSLALQLTADYLTCQIDCVPYRYTLTLDLPVSERRQPDPDMAALIATWSERVPVPARSVPGLVVTSRLDRGPRSTLELRIEGDGLRASHPDLFFESDDALSLGRPTADVGDRGVVFRVAVSPKVLGHPIANSAHFKWTVTGIERNGRLLPVEGDAVPGAETASPTESLGWRSAAQHWPTAVAALAVLALWSALGLWGYFAEGANRPTRSLLGFAALAVALLPLYLLSLTVRSEALALIEILLLATGLLVWSHRHAVRRPSLRAAFLIAAIACSIIGLWLAATSSLVTPLPPP